MDLPKRGATINPRGRFERLEIALDEEFTAGADNPRTVYLRDDSQTLITTNDSPDISFRASLNPYRGCEHGCSYCYARPYHEYLGFSAGIDFETRILVKPAAPELLRRELSSPKWQPQVLAMSGVTDCYQPVERRLQITRRCLQVLAEFRNPVGIVTKNHLVTRDIDVLAELAQHQAAHVHVSVTTMDSRLARRLEPRASSPSHRIEAIAQLAAAGIPVGVLLAPVIPGLTEHEIPAILSAARQAGATGAGYTMLRLPYAVKDIFSAWLEAHCPDAKEKVLGRIREVRGGALNRSEFGSRMRGEGVFADHIGQLFQVAAAR
ncbi:MAG TPA: PA0069 family radical SAM protein, partial [Terrimicrobiaceae bacterium]|nr:PA0069 family radical SAM protein [Terrimicrobiaceae bacterium]